MKRIDRGKVGFVCSLCLASFGLGLGTMEFQTFPYSVVREAHTSVTALWKSFKPGRENDEASHSKEKLNEPAVRRHAGVAGNELILVAGGRDYMKSHSPEYGALAWIMD